MKSLVKKQRRGSPAAAWLLLALSIAAFLLVLLLPLGSLALTGEERALRAAWAEGQVIRLHILAEDDTPAAQATKLVVRDAVLDAFGAALAGAATQSGEAAYALLEQSLPKLQETALQAARSCGFTGSVETEVGVLLLPEKQYGSVVLPAGRYRALRITLGQGKGQNWWCVLFPRLCLSLAGQPSPQPEPDQPVCWEWKSLRVLALWPLLSPEGVATTVPPPEDACGCPPHPN